MTRQQEQVLRFMRMFEQHLEVVPKLPPEDVAKLAMQLIREESDELSWAFYSGDLVKVADAVADLLYVTYWTANACGFDLEPVFEEVHRSNLSKVGGKKTPEGKVIKPAGYSPANIQAVLAPWKG